MPMKLILTHSNADFDALASLLAASRLYRGAWAVLPQRMNRNLREFLSIYQRPLPFVSAESLPRQPVTQIILVDTQQVPALPFALGPFVPQIEIIDHHPESRTFAENEHYGGGVAGATTTLLVQRMYERRLRLSSLEATLLLLGIYEDTGSLTYAGTTAADLRAAAWLLERGANLHILSQFLNLPLNEGQLQIYNRLVATAEVREVRGWTIVLAHAESAGYVEEVSTLAHRLMDLYDPAGLFLVVQFGGAVQVIARSTGEAVSAGEVMARFGGGGHAQAAAAFLPGRQGEEVRRELWGVLEEMVQPMRAAREIMTARVHTIGPQATLAEAAEVLARYGHGSLPVVDGAGRLVGLFTRRDLDRALHHGLEGASLETYMWKGPVTIPPDLPVDKVRQCMVDNDVGRLLVVDEEGVLQGIITRTDLLKLWPEVRAPEQESAESWTGRLREALPGAIWDLLQQAGQLAEEVGFALYIVGGFVRDLLLGQPNLDLDLVVEGDAIALAKELARRLGGRARSHRRFGTAKWILEQADASLPRHLDFVTARTEFYEHPTALPTVEASSLRQDLYRRDFTINTLAIGLSGEKEGRLIDFFGGQRDLERRLIRVLHNLSFIEDPTRIMRAVRLEQRLGFAIEPRTMQLLEDAVGQGLLERTTGERIRHELFLILEEREPEQALRRLDSLGVLERISPHLIWTDWIEGCFRRVREEVEGDERAVLYLALLCYDLPDAEVEALIGRYRFRARHSHVLREVLQLRREVLPALLAGGLSPSQVYHLLRPFSATALRLLQLAEEDAGLRAMVADYLGRLRFVRPVLDGNDLRALGLVPGPRYKEILGALLAARLDGHLHSRADEESFVKEYMAEKGL